MATKQGKSSDQTYYYANDERVPLHPSTHYVAVKPAGKSSDADEAAASLSGVAASGDVMTIPERDLVIIRIPEVQGGNGASAASVRRDATSRAGVSAGPTVYELEDDTGLGLIPTGEVLVCFEESVSDTERRAILSEAGLTILREDDPEPGAFLASASDESKVFKIANDLHEDDRVIYAEPEFTQISKRPAAGDRRGEGDVALDTHNGEGGGTQTAMNAPTQVLDIAEAERQERDQSGELGAQASFNDPGLSSQWALRRIRAPQAWDIAQGAGTTVAILDEGCDVSHEDITYVAGFDGIDGGAPSPAGNDAHGTACAGIVGMRAGNSRGGVGVAPQTRIMPIRIARGIGGGSWYTTSSIVSRSIRWAVDHGADVLSNSYSVGPSTAVTRAFQHASANGRGGKGCVIAAAAGNTDRGSIIYPARLSPTMRGFLAVGASNEWDQRKSRTSSDGETWWGSCVGPELDVVAPGVHIYTSDITGAAGYAGGAYVPNFNGTSSATPHVAGLAALVLSVDRGLRGFEVEDIIKRTARDLGAGGRDDDFGYGRIDARNALEAASRLWYDIRAVPVFLGRYRDCFMRLRVRMYNPGINTVRLDSLVLRSHTSDWSSVIDQFTYRPDPGGGNVLRPFTGDDVTFDRVLLQANGSQRRRWSYRWSASWTYTYWRPSGPGLPLAAEDPMAVAGTPGPDGYVRGEGGSSAEAIAADGLGAMEPADQDGAEPMAMSQTGDTVEIDRASRQITIVLR